VGPALMLARRSRRRDATGTALRVLPHAGATSPQTKVRSSPPLLASKQPFGNDGLWPSVPLRQSRA